MYKDIRKKFIINLVAGGGIVIVLTFVIIILYELDRIDKYAGSLALKESDKYFKYYYNFYQNRSNSGLLNLELTVEKNLSHNLFIQIEFLDELENRILVKSIKRYAGIKRILNERFEKFKMTGKVDYMKTYSHGQLYVKVMVPVFDKNINKVIGHFEGIYHVSNEELAKIKKQVVLSLIQSFAIIFITTLLLYPVILLLNKKLIFSAYELLESNINTLKSLGSALAKRDSGTNVHNYRVTIYAVKLAEEIKLNKFQIQSLIKGAFLHDIGKIGIIDSILLKPDELTDDETILMKQHVILGVDIIKNNRWLEDAADIVRYHHEKFNGSGYMSGLKGRHIPIIARIFTIVDVFDALTSKRPYKNPYNLEESLKILKEGAGSHFDPELLGYFIQIADRLYSELKGEENESQLNKQLNLHVDKYFSVLT